MTDQTPTPGMHSAAPTGVRIPMLVSAILNILTGLAWGFGCVTIVIGIPLIVLAVFEFMTYGKLGGPDYRRHADRARTIQIIEICTILLGSVGSMICGIIGLVIASQERERGNF